MFTERSSSRLREVLFSPDTNLDNIARDLESLNLDDKEKIKELTKKQQIMSDHLLDQFAINMEAFEKYMPDIAKTFKNYKPEKTMEFFCTDNGIPNLIFIESNDILYKTFDPFELCKKQINNIIENNIITQTRYGIEKDPYGQLHFKYLKSAVEIESSLKRDYTLTAKKIGSIPNCVLLGVGLGYEIAYLYEQVEVANLILVEPDLDMFYASLYAFDWANLLKYLAENKLGIHLMLGQTPEKFYQDMTKFYDIHGRFLTGTWLGIVHYSNKKVKEIAEVIIKDYESMHAAMGFFDDHLFGTSHAIANVLTGKSFVLKEPLVPEDMAQTPVFIIGSGPSLDNDIDFIKKNQDKALIVACGTALDTLYHAGIKPDIYACTERTPEISESLDMIPDKDFINDMILLTGDVVHPKTTARFKHTAIFGKIDEPFIKYVAALNENFRKVRTVQLMNPLVGNMGVSGMLYLGFKNLYLFGLDNGKKIGTEYDLHSKYTATYKEHGNQTSRGVYKLTNIVPANFGGQVESNYFYKLSAHNIDFILRIFKNEEKINVSCINCSDGALIESAKSMHSYELDFNSKADVDKKEIFNFIVNKKTAPIDVPKEFFEQVFFKNEFNCAVDKICNLLKTKASSRTEAIQIMEQVSEIDYYLRANASTYFIGNSLEGSLQTYFIIGARALYNSPDEKKCLEKFHQIMDVITDFLDETKSIYTHMPNYSLGEHRKYHKGGKVGIDYPSTPATKMPRIRHLKKKFDDPLKKFVKKYE